MNNCLYKKMIFYLFNELGLEESSIELGIKLSIKNKTPLPILLWSYGMLTIEELDKLYSFLFQKIDLWFCYNWQYQNKEQLSFQSKEIKYQGNL